MHVGVLDTETTKRRRRDHVEGKTREPQFTRRTTASTDRLKVQMTCVKTSVVLRTHLSLGDQLEVAFTLMLGVGPELYLIADLGRVHEVAGV